MYRYAFLCKGMDTNSKGIVTQPKLLSQVLSPLLTADAIDLLTNCLTSRETELWQNLGEAWCVPRSMWKYNVPPYQPGEV